MSYTTHIGVTEFVDTHTHTHTHTFTFTYILYLYIYNNCLLSFIIEG